MAYGEADGKIYVYPLIQEVDGKLAVTKDGKVVNFRAKGASGNGEEGPKAGFRLAIQLASEYTTGYVLICLAGMKYAVYVEAMENKDVISSASDHTEEWIKKQSKVLFDKLTKKGY